MSSRTDETSPDSTCCSPEREAQSLGDLGFGKSTPQTKCDHMDETDYVAAIRIGKGHLFFSRSIQTSLQKCHTVAQASSKIKLKKNKSNNKPKETHLSVFPIQRSAQHAVGQQSSRMLYKSAISMSSKGSAGWTKVHSSHCSHVMLASREQNVISITFFPVTVWSHRAHISTSVPCCKPQIFPEVVLGVMSGYAKPWKEAGQSGCSTRCCKQKGKDSLPRYPRWHRQHHRDNADLTQSAVAHMLRMHSVYRTVNIQKNLFPQGSPHPSAFKTLAFIE